MDFCALNTKSAVEALTLCAVNSQPRNTASAERITHGMAFGAATTPFPTQLPLRLQ